MPLLALFCVILFSVVKFNLRLLSALNPCRAGQSYTNFISILNCGLALGPVHGYAGAEARPHAHNHACSGGAHRYNTNTHTPKINHTTPRPTSPEADRDLMITAIDHHACDV